MKVFPKMDPKFYGEIRKVKNNEIVPESQWMLFLIKDNAFAAVFPQYIEKCKELGCDAAQIAGLERAQVRMNEWREAHSELCKNPDAAGELLLDLPAR